MLLRSRIQHVAEAAGVDLKPGRTAGLAVKLGRPVLVEVEVREITLRLLLLAGRPAASPSVAHRPRPAVLLVHHIMAVHPLTRRKSTCQGVAVPGADRTM